MDTPHSGPLTIRVTQAPAVSIIRLGGMATIDEAERLTAELRRIAGEACGRLVVDLTDLEFICSMGLGALIVAHIVSQRRRCELVLAAPQPAIRDVLFTTRLDKIFPVYADVKAAVS
ncbi:MAG: hypothetical protein BIFFINMI_00416 [Phycisphaerae bacterium]|nr:hypothetical protein [Phycisphaerae bacterium]